MSLRAVKQIIETTPTIEGAGVKLQRAFGFGKTKEFDPFLLLDDFRNENPADYLAGFPWHPHRGIETITYVLAGEVESCIDDMQLFPPQARVRWIDDRGQGSAVGIHKSGNNTGNIRDKGIGRRIARHGLINITVISIGHPQPKQGQPADPVKTLVRGFPGRACRPQRNAFVIDIDPEEVGLIDPRTGRQGIALQVPVATIAIV